MPFNLLLFPLVAGYYVIVRSRFLKYWQQRLERQRLLFNSIIAGTFLLLFAFLLTKTSFILNPAYFEKVARFSPIQLPYFGTTLLSFLLGIFVAETSNLFIKNEKAVQLAIKLIGNELELLFNSSWSEPHLIQLTLKNDKVYVGWVKVLPIPNHSSYISILPAFSGYRSKEKRELVFTTQYLDVYSTYVSSGDVRDINNLANLVIKIDDISSASEFDIEMFERFNSTQIVESPAAMSDNTLA